MQPSPVGFTHTAEAPELPYAKVRTYGPITSFMANLQKVERFGIVRHNIINYDNPRETNIKRTSSDISL